MAAADEVSLGRLIVESGGENPAFVDLDVGITERFCGDADGCEVVLVLRGKASVASQTGRIFLDTVSHKWFSTGSAPGNVYLADLNGTGQQVLFLLVAPNNCLVSDGEAASGGPDLLPGFSLYVWGDDSPTATCTLTMSD